MDAHTVAWRTLCPRQAHLEEEGDVAVDVCLPDWDNAADQSVASLSVHYALLQHEC